MGEFEFTADPAQAIDRLIDCESETLEALQAAIEPTGREAASEAVEHRLEHMIMRKQEQVDYLLRAQAALGRCPGAPALREWRPGGTDACNGSDKGSDLPSVELCTHAVLKSTLDASARTLVVPWAYS